MSRVVIMLEDLAVQIKEVGFSGLRWTTNKQPRTIARAALTFTSFLSIETDCQHTYKIMADWQPFTQTASYFLILLYS